VLLMGPACHAIQMANLTAGTVDTIAGWALPRPG